MIYSKLFSIGNFGHLGAILDFRYIGFLYGLDFRKFEILDPENTGIRTYYKPYI